MRLRECAMDCGRNKILRVGKNSGPILGHLWSKVHEILELCRGPLYFPTHVPYCLCPILVRRYSPIAIVSKSWEKRTNVKFYWPQFLGRTTPTFLLQTVSGICCLPFGKLWLSSVCEAWQWSRKQNLRRVGKMTAQL